MFSTSSMSVESMSRESSKSTRERTEASESSKKLEVGVSTEMEACAGCK